MKHLSKILYLIGGIIFITAIITTSIAIFDEMQTLRMFGIIFAFVGGGVIGSAFFLDFRTTMILNETQGDEFTLMSKEKLISILDNAGIEYEKDKGREYYLYLVREYAEKE